MADIFCTFFREREKRDNVGSIPFALMGLQLISDMQSLVYTPFISGPTLRCAC